MFQTSRVRYTLAALVIGGLPVTAQTPEYRASWADAFHTGYLSQGAVTTTVGNLRSGNCNVFVPEIYVNSGSQLIYWNPAASEYADLGAAGTIVSNGVQIKCDLNSDPETNSAYPFDPLAESIRQCHDTSAGKARLNVWAWLVSFRSAGALPGNHPSWITVNAGGAAQTDFDPGHPGAEQQLVNTCLDIVKHYDVDGLNLDYIRFTDSNNGFNAVSVARYNAINGKSGTPSTSDAAFMQWRRDQITNVVRKIYLSVIAVKPSVKISADTIQWYPSPARPPSTDANPLQTWKANFESASAAYNSVYQDWRSWMEEGILDISMPMAYLDECSYKATFDKWSDFTKDNQFGRQCVIGTGGYLNTLSDELAQYLRTRDPSSTMGRYGAGQNNYSYTYPYAATCGGTAVADPTGWLDTLKSGMYSQAASVPVLPRLTNGKGHIKGTVIDSLVASPGWLDGAAVALSQNPDGSNPVRAMTTDGTGFYGFVDVAPGTYYVKIAFAGLKPQMRQVVVTAANVSTVNFDLGVTASQLAFVTQPGGAPANATLSPQPVVAVKDANGNVCTAFAGTVSLGILTGTGTAGAALNGAATVIPVNGVAAFSGLSINKAGTGYELAATSEGLPPANSAPFSVDVVPTKLVVLTQPAPSNAGEVFRTQPVFAAQDDAGNLAPSFSGPVSVSILAGTGYPGATLGGTTIVNAVNGVAAFTGLSIDKVGYAYRLTATSGSLAPANTVGFDIATTAVKLAFETQPGGAKSGRPFAVQPVIVALNAAGTPALDYVGTAVVGIKDGAGASTAYLEGTTAVDFVSGRAAFPDLSISDPGSGYVLAADSGTLPMAESAPFDVVYGGPFTLNDAIRAASLAGGLDTATSADITRLDVDMPAGVDLLDAARIMRKVSGLEPNP